MCLTVVSGDRGKSQAKVRPVKQGIGSFSELSLIRDWTRMGKKRGEINI